MKMENISRALLFVVFFSIGATALSGSILCDVLLRYYHSRQLLKVEEDTTKKVVSQNADYNALRQQLEKDPNIINRIAPIVLGVDAPDANTVYPKATVEQIAAARKASGKEVTSQCPEPMTPTWLTRCSEPRRRITLFLAGAALVLVSFICFGPARQAPPKEP